MQGPREPLGACALFARRIVCVDLAQVSPGAAQEQRVGPDWSHMGASPQGVLCDAEPSKNYGWKPWHPLGSNRGPPQHSAPGG